MTPTPWRSSKLAVLLLRTNAEQLRLAVLDLGRILETFY